MEKEAFSVSWTSKPSCYCNYCFLVNVSDRFHNTTAADSHNPLIYGNVSFYLKSFAQSHSLLLAKPKETHEVWKCRILWAICIHLIFFFKCRQCFSWKMYIHLWTWPLCSVFSAVLLRLTVHSKLSLGWSHSHVVFSKATINTHVGGDHSRDDQLMASFLVLVDHVVIIFFNSFPILEPAYRGEGFANNNAVKADRIAILYLLVLKLSQEHGS